MNKNSQVIIPPHSQNSEIMVLGSMLTNINSFNIAAEALEDYDFYFLEHKIIFQALKKAYKEDKPADIHLIAEYLTRHNKLDSVRTRSVLVTLAQSVGTSVFIEEYVKELRNHSAKRKILDLSRDLRNAALSADEAQKIILSAQSSLKSIEKNCNSKDKFSIKFLDEVDKNYFLVEPPRKAMLLDYANNSIGFLPKGIVGMLVGGGGVGKTHLLSQLAISVATGTPFLDMYTPTAHCGINSQGNVFFGLGENGDEDIHRLLFKASKHLRKKEPTFLAEDNILASASKRIATFSFCGQQASFIENGKPSIYFREFKFRLEEIAPENGWTLIILDPVSRLMGVDAETDNAAATQFIALLEELTIDLPGNPTILFAHHTNKASLQGSSQNQSAARGSSALTDGVRWQCNYSKESPDTNIAVLRMTKTNFTALMEDIKTQKDFDGFIYKAKTTPNENKKKTVISHGENY